EGKPPYRAVCDCRKPAPGLLQRAALELDLDLTASAMVGDKASDLVPARTVGARNPRADRLRPRRVGVSPRRAPGRARLRRRRFARCGGVGAVVSGGVNARLRALVDAFAGKTLVVAGDLITDEYLYGKPARISREAPVLILRFTEREVSLGGAGNAAHNVHDLAARVVPIGVIGKDAAGDELLALFHTTGIPTDGIVSETGRVTPVKTRIMAGGYQATR